MLAKHMNSVRQRWRTNLSPSSITLTPFAYAYTKSGAACPDQDAGEKKNLQKGLTS